MREYNLMRLSPEVDLDPVLVESMKRMFEWANQEGLRGNRVTGLRFIEPIPNMMGLRGNIMVNCFVHGGDE